MARTMSVCSFMMIMPAVPSPRQPPRKRTSSKSSLMSSWLVPSTPMEMPPQMAALYLPPFIPPAMSIDCWSVMPSSFSYTPGLLRWPDMPKSLGPGDEGVPIDLNHAGPFSSTGDRRERRLVSRPAALAFQRFQQSRLFAADVRPRAAVDVALNLVLAAED